MDTNLILSLVIALLVAYALIQLAKVGLRWLRSRSKKVEQVARQMATPLPPRPTRIYTRTFIYADGHTITQRANGEKLSRLTDAFGQSLYPKSPLVEVKDT